MKQEKIQAQVANKAGVESGAAGGGTIFTEPVLVVNQKAKLLELNSEYAVYDQNGTQIGAKIGGDVSEKVGLSAAIDYVSSDFDIDGERKLRQVGALQIAISSSMHGGLQVFS